MADEEKGLSAAVDAAEDSEETESGSEEDEEEEEESFEEYESGGEEAAGEPDAVKTDAAPVSLISVSRFLIFLIKMMISDSIQ